MTDILDELGLKQPEPILTATTPQDARFILACCSQWVPDGDTRSLAALTDYEFRDYLILRLMVKILPVYLDHAQEVEYTIGEIAYILHYLRGDDSYNGGGAFQDKIVGVLRQLLEGGD